MFHVHDGGDSGLCLDGFGTMFRSYTRAFIVPGFFGTMGGVCIVVLDSKCIGDGMGVRDGDLLGCTVIVRKVLNFPGSTPVQYMSLRGSP